MTDVTSILHNSEKPFHVFGFTESRLSSTVADSDINVPGFKTIRKDPTCKNSTGILIYINETLTFKRLDHLEHKLVEAVWIEIKLKHYKPIKIGILYRNPIEKIDWKDKFSCMLDTVSIDATEILLLVDFNIDLLKPKVTWTDKMSSYNFTQLVDKPTRITPTSKTLLDHIYTTEKRNIVEICVPTYGVSDHFPTCLTWSKKGIKIPMAQSRS